MTNLDIELFNNKRVFKINWTIFINDQSLGQKKKLSIKSKNIAKKYGFYEKGNTRMDKFKMRINIKEGII